MSVEQNKALVKRFFEEVSRIQGDASKIPSLISDFIAPGFVSHSAQGDTGFDQLSQMWGMLFTAFPDFDDKVVDIIAEGDKVVTRSDVTSTHKGNFQGMPPTGKQVRVAEACIWRVAGNKIAEEWVFLDLLGMMQQLGAIPSAPPKG